MSKIRYTLLIGALFLALVLSAVNTAPVFADESAPPEETPTHQTESAETEPTVPEEEAAQPLSEVDSAEGGESNPVTEILQQLPEGTEIVVVDENGEAVSLASQQAEEAVVLGDPRWCPVGVVPGGAGCSPMFSKFLGGGVDDSLINWLAHNNPAKAGVIWIEASYDSTTNETSSPTDITLDGSLLTNMANYALTINGGWSGSNNTVMSSTDLSEFHIPFKIIGWNAPITINNISVNGLASGTYALEVGTAKGAITLNNVEVVNNTVTQAGASLTNDLATVPAGVTVNNSNFNNNTANGLEITSKGVVTLKNVNANDNADYGASIDNTPAPTAQAVNLLGTNNFSYNGLDGLYITSKGAITINYISANYNGKSGAFLDNCNMNFTTGFCQNTFPSAVTLKGVNNFSYNGWDGLRVFSGGAISVSNIIANNNGTDPARFGDVNTYYDAYGKGVYLDNSGATAKRVINVLGVNIFNDNISNGLFAYSKGLITLTNITANRNSCDEIKEGDDAYCAGVYLLSYGGVTQTGYANFIDNLKDGIRITTYNTPVTLTTVMASDNGKDGIHIDGGISTLPASVVINGLNVTNNNGRFGTWVLTNGAVTISNLTSNYNTNSGLFVDNRNASSARGITLKGVNNFQQNGDTGLTLQSRGAITTSSLNIVENSGQAAIIDNCDYSIAENKCLAYTTTVNMVVTYQPVSMLGTNYIYKNANGLLVNSRGSIIITNLTSVFNTDDGATLRNDYTNAVGNVSVTGLNNFSHNGNYGLEIVSRGAVSLANITANYNSLGGVEISNNVNTAKPVNVTISGTNRFNDNKETGLTIRSYGVVTLYNITANGNGNPDAANGVFIDNATGTTTARAVFVYGYNYFNDNYGTGLHILSKGAITIQRVTANNNINGGHGAYLNNVVPSGTQPVVVSVYGIFMNNAASGLTILSNGTVTASNLTASDNLTDGVSIDTQYGATSTSSVNVTIAGYNNFVSNGLNGLKIYTDGAITLSNIFANANENNGVFLDNLTYADSSINKTIVFNGVSNLSGNQNNGLEFFANGAVTLNRITANYNKDLGLYTGSGIKGTMGGAGVKTITILCGSMMGNEVHGLHFTGATAITLRGLYLGQTNSFNVAPVITRSCTLP